MFSAVTPRSNTSTALYDDSVGFSRVSAARSPCSVSGRRVFRRGGIVKVGLIRAPYRGARRRDIHTAPGTKQKVLLRGRPGNVHGPRGREKEANNKGRSRLRPGAFSRGTFEGRCSFIGRKRPRSIVVCLSSTRRFCADFVFLLGADGMADQYVAVKKSRSSRPCLAFEPPRASLPSSACYVPILRFPPSFSVPR